MTSAQRLAALTCAGLVATTVAGCGSVTKAVTGSDPGGAIVMGTTSVTNVLDPAGAYDNGSWLLLHNTFQSLLKFPAGSSAPSPDAAQSCEFTGSDATTYHCTLRAGLKFSNGHPLTAQDVVFSIERMKKIKDDNGPSSLLDSITSVQAKGDTEVTFQLSQPDAVLPAKLASSAGAIVDHQVFPADKLLPNDKLVGSGPYKIDSVETMAAEGGTKVPGKVTLVANEQYNGDEKLRNKKFTLRYFLKGADLKTALDTGEVDLTDNSLDPGAGAQYLADQQAGKTAVQVADGDSSETRYLAFNTKDAVTGNPAVRQAVAQLLDRKVLARDVYARTVQPLYSVVPAGVAGHNTAFFDKYGDPDVAKAKQILTAAKVSLPVKMSLTWSRARAEGAEAAEIKKQLEASGLFQVAVTQEADWDKFKKGWKAGTYQAYTIGWTADYPDADNFVAPLVVDGGAYHTGWNDARISDKLLPESLKQADRAAAGAIFAQMQNITAEGVPLIPIFQAKSFYASRSNITGVESTVDTTGVFRFWEIGRSK
ncbi:ABC transporter substrate-binding protein [Kitasatospora sp. NPDC057015]|uniref:ABC transporter substrate-binding protein n=1 Tax=Kitasatospora sp. NPDC057015 TaxID=3346001 RepID=UPI003634DF8D